MMMSPPRLQTQLTNGAQQANVPFNNNNSLNQTNGNFNLMQTYVNGNSTQATAMLYNQQQQMNLQQQQSQCNGMMSPTAINQFQQQQMQEQQNLQSQQQQHFSTHHNLNNHDTLSQQHLIEECKNIFVEVDFLCSNIDLEDFKLSNSGVSFFLIFQKI